MISLIVAKIRVPVFKKAGFYTPDVNENEGITNLVRWVGQGFVKTVSIPD
jgi:hypothetical protein